MKYFLSVFLQLLTLITLLHDNLSAQSNKVRYNINGNLSTYTTLSKDSLTHFTFFGPGKVIVISRAHFKNNGPDTLSYDILYQVDNVKIRTFHAKNVVRMPETSFIQSSGDRPSTSRTFTIKIDPELHDIGFSLLKKSPKVDILCKFVPDSVPKWRDLKPINDSVKIILKPDESPSHAYYQMTSSKSQKFKITGPATLRIITRLEYNYTMQGTLSYRVRVSEDQSPIKTYKLSGNPSIETQYVNRSKFVPGTFERFYLQVPEGVHYYDFSLLDKTFSCLIRVSKQINAK